MEMVLYTVVKIRCAVLQLRYAHLPKLMHFVNPSTFNVIPFPNSYITTWIRLVNVVIVVLVVEVSNHGTEPSSARGR